MRTVLAATCFATALAVAGAGAQTTGQYGQQQDRDRDKTINVTGCLQSGEEAGSFVLAVDRSEYQRAMQQAGITGEFAEDRQPRATAGEPGAIGTTGAEARDRDKEKIHLTDVPADVNLQNKVNQQVRVSGSLEMKDRDRDRAAGTTAHTTHPTGAPTGTAGDRDRDDKKKAKLDVASVQVLAQTCPQQDAR